jgi:transcriptional regulator of acetoin/glycerol metabolism
MATDWPDDFSSRDKLAALGVRRKEHDKLGTDLSDEIREVLKDADGDVTLAEAAELLGVHRTTIYRVYRSKR